MIEILESAKHLVAMRVSGNVTAEDVDKAYKATEEALKDNERISFFAEIGDSTSADLEGVFKDLKEGLGQFGKLSRYYRAAVVTNKGWMGALARVEGLVFSSIDVRVFKPEEREKALAWASEAPAPLPKPEDAASVGPFLQTTSDNVFAYEVNGRVREKDIKAIAAQLKPYFEREGKINVLARMTDYKGFDLLAALNDDLVRLKYKAFSKVERYAVVGASNWMRNFLSCFADVRHEGRVFEASEETGRVGMGRSRTGLAGGKERISRRQKHDCLS